jgi:D-amino-acid oxidase
MSNKLLSRRVLLGGTTLLSAACAARRAKIASSPPPPAQLLAPVQVAKDRVIRVTVGLRPFRPAGFVVRGEKLGDKTVIHNYGHGGAGITLSWGTAQLAVQEAAKIEGRNAAVIGCGVVGLSTARLLQLRGYAVTIYSRDLPPSTTSNLAGGLWDPVTVYDHDRVTPEFRRQFGEAARFAFRRFQSFAGDLYGVRWLPYFQLSRDGPMQSSPPESPMNEVNPLYPEQYQLTRENSPFDVPFGRHRDSMLIEPAIYLQALTRDFLLQGGRIVVREFHSVQDVTALSENPVFNCSGLGARELFGDTELTPVRGQLVFLLPQPEVNYMTAGPGNIYMFPRRDGILLGGSHELGDWNQEPDPATTERILRDNGILFGSMRRRAAS